MLSTEPVWPDGTDGRDEGPPAEADGQNGVRAVLPPEAEPPQAVVKVLPARHPHAVKDLDRVRRDRLEVDLDPPARNCSV